MKTILDYEIETEIYKSTNSIVYRAKKVAGKNSIGDERVILKILRNEFPNPEDIARVHREYEITQSLKGDGIIEAYNFAKFQNKFVLVLEDFGGESLINYMNSKNFTVEEFLPLAIRITEILGRVHEKHIIHKDINPSNIVCNAKSGKIKLIDFGISSELSHETTSLRNANALEGTLNYMSPEQTGRMNRTIDYRTDLYSLGATFYHVLTGKVPFLGKDAMEIVHCHIAKDPTPPHKINPEIPEVLSQIIMRLMAKTAENRYQSTYGLIYDLKWCLDNFGKLNALNIGSTFDSSAHDLSLQIGAHDISDRFEIPQKLYGREKEVETLLNSFERVNQYSKEIILIGGYSGIGKSAIVQEIYKPIVERKGIFIRGKFDQYKRNIPYASLVQAFQDLVKQILTESEEELSIYKSKILSALGQNAQVIVDVIPEVELIIGKQPGIRTLSSEESKNRFNLVFRNFVRVFASGQTPIVIFLDDLQWADLPSLHLLELIITDKEIGNILVIGAYRDNEVDPTHPLLITLEEIKNQKIIANTILLSPLNLSDVSLLIADTISVPMSESATLASLCFEKTQGNPFFLNQFLKMLHQEQLISFAPKERKWKWDINEIRKQGITDNVIDLMTRKIQKLSDVTQNTLRLSACIGNQFDLKTLSTVNKKSLKKTAIELWESVKEGLIVPLSETYNLVGVEDNIDLSIDNNIFDSIVPEYRFLHDRVQQAAYSLIPEEDRKKVHLEVGRLLLEKSNNENQEKKLFDIVNHLNIGFDLITDQVECEKLIELNLSVSQKAKLSAAFEPAFNYAKNAITFIGKNPWETNFALSLKSHIEALETGYLCGQFEQMEIILETLLKQNLPHIDLAKVYEIKIKSCVSRNDSLGAVRNALEILKILGTELQQNPSQEEIGKQLGDTMQRMSKYQIDDLFNLPRMNDPLKIAELRIMNLIFSSCYQVAPGLYALLVFEMLRITLEYGNSSISAIGYSCYGLFLCGMVGDVETGYNFGKLALDLINKINDESVKPSTYYNVAVFMQHWKEPLRNTLKPLLDSYKMGILVGDFEFASFAGWIYNSYSYFAGGSLIKIIEETKKYRQWIQEIKQETSVGFISIFLQAVINLVENPENPSALSGEFYNEEKMLPVHIKTNDNTSICTVYFHKLVLNYLMDEIELGLQNADMTEKYIGGLPASQYVPLFHLYDSLTRLAHYPQSEDKEAILNKVAANQTKMKTWADHCESNFLHKYYLVEAEKARVLGEDLQAINLYDLSAKLAKENEFIQEEALANELYAQFWFSREKEELGQMLLNKAYYLYSIWGAETKVNQLEKKYGHLISKKGNVSKNSTIIAGTSSVSIGENSQTLDLVSVMKASQSISGEIVIEELLKSMMHIVIENAGAQTGYLLQEKKDNWVIEAQGQSSQKEVTVLQSIQVHADNIDIPKVPLSILQYVARTKESVVLEDASLDSQYMTDSYIMKNKPKSVLCSAILSQGKLLGILYLENNSISGVFTPERLEIIKILSAQAAISLENATLYSKLEEKVAERTAQLEEAHKKIIILEKETTEKQLAGGFAHEMRNALAGPKLVIQHTLGQDRESQESLNLINSRKLKELYLLIKDKVSESTLHSALQLMKTIFENEEQLEKSLHMIYKAVSKGLNITQLIMDYSKVGNEQVGKQWIDLNVTLSNLLKDFEADLIKNKISIQRNIADKTSQIQGMETHFESVYKNLILNAKDALLDKSIGDERERLITIKTEVFEDNFIFEITDNGCGISQEHLGKIYDAFFSTKPDSGTGLGLGVVKKIINLYNGHIKVKSELGKGSQFTVTLPLKRSMV